MKLASLLLAAVAVLVIQGTAHAQGLSGSALSVRSSLNDLLATVDKKVDREEGRDRIKDTIQRARAELSRVYTLADAGAPRSALGESVSRARELTAASLWMVRGARSDSVRHFAGNVRDRLDIFDADWAHYNGYERRGGYGYGE